MTVRDLKNNIDAAHSLEPAVRPTGTYNGTSVDLAGYHAALLLLYVGAYTNGTHTPTLEHSDDNVSFTTASAAELDGSFTPISSAGSANSVQRVGYRGSKRYVRAVMTVASGATGAASAALIVRGMPVTQPV